MEKEFDAVKMMRDIRDKLHAEYRKDPKLREKRLAVIRKKYGLQVAKMKPSKHKPLAKA